MGMGIGNVGPAMCAVEFEYLWNVGLHNVRLTSFESRGVTVVRVCVEFLARGVV